MKQIKLEVKSEDELERIEREISRIREKLKQKLIDSNYPNLKSED